MASRGTQLMARQSLIGYNYSLLGNFPQVLSCLLILTYFDLISSFWLVDIFVLVGFVWWQWRYTHGLLTVTLYGVAMAIA